MTVVRREAVDRIEAAGRIETAGRIGAAGRTGDSCPLFLRVSEVSGADSSHMVGMVSL